MQLELKHLASYLPYKLQVIDDQRVIRSLRGLSIFNEATLSYNDIGEEDSIQFDEFKPLLRPLSSLTKEITHNGETFVPIVELAKIGTREINCYVTNDNIGTCYVDAEYQKKGFFIYHPDGYFMWQVGKNAEPLTVWNQKKLFQKLYEWHFDLDSLIDNGLAINLETLK